MRHHAGQSGHVPRDAVVVFSYQQQGLLLSKATGPQQMPPVDGQLPDLVCINWSQTVAGFVKYGTTETSTPDHST